MDGKELQIYIRRVQRFADRLGDMMRDIYENAVSRKGLLDLVTKDR